MSRVKHLRFEQCQIDVRWTFRRATLTGETIAKRGIEFSRFQRIMSIHAYLECGANDVGAPAGGHDFVTCGDESRAHDRCVLAATAATVALFEIADEGAILERKRQARRERKLQWPRKIVPQVIVDLMPAVAQDFARVENVFWIKSLFDLAHESEQFVAELLPHVIGARDPDAVLRRKRTLELPNERRRLISDEAEFF